MSQPPDVVGLSRRRMVRLLLAKPSPTEPLARLVLLAIGCLSLVLTAGCILAPILPGSHFTMKTTIGVRLDLKTNVIECLVVQKWFVVRASMITEPSYTRCYRTRVVLERTNEASIRYTSLERLCGDDP